MNFKITQLRVINNVIQGQVILSILSNMKEWCKFGYEIHFLEVET